MMKNLWHIGNTTVRSPYRLKDALSVLIHSQYHGNLLGKDNESGFAESLHDRSILKADRIEKFNLIKTDQMAELNKPDFSDLGRKWRSALAQLGFLVRHLTIGHKRGIDKQYKYFMEEYDGFSGIPYEVTPNGKNLIQATSVSAVQECFLRALLAYRIPSIFETRYQFQSFSPLRHVLKILVELENRSAKPVIQFWEMSLVQSTIPEDRYDIIVDTILENRKDRQFAVSKKEFDNEMRLKATGGNDTQAKTLVDYADLNLRYLRATGLFQSSGKGITILPEKRVLVEKILETEMPAYEKNRYIHELWCGASLPTDDRTTALTVIHSIVDNIRKYDENTVIPELGNQTEQEISSILHDLEEELRKLKEIDYANKQVINWKEILCYMHALGKPGKQTSYNDEEVRIPSGEAPAYFEWIVWRAFLAVNSLINNPWDSRRFKIDQDFLPIAPAPGRGPDLIFEFRDYVLAVEVTLTSSSRQEAAEGEPVRRHVAEIAEKYEKFQKQVYGFFIALSIDSNTANTFKDGNWYKPDDSKLPLQIIPVTLNDFARLFEAGFMNGKLSPQQIRELIIECRALGNYDAPKWKIMISNEVNKLIKKIQEYGSESY